LPALPGKEKPTDRLKPPQKVELEGGARVSVGSIDVPTPMGPLACWSYLSEGLLRQGSSELLFLLRRTPADLEPSTVPLRAFAAVATRGGLVRAGGCTAFPSDPYFAQRGWAGWMYLPPQRGSGISPQTVHAIAVTAAELEVVAAVGATRIAARLARAASYWPCPPWSEPHPSFAADGDTLHSILSKVTVTRGLDLSVTRYGERMRLRLPRSAAVELRDTMPAEPPLTFAALLGDEADGCMVWTPGQLAPTAIHAPGGTGQSLAAAFLQFLPGDADAVTFVEDGVVARLTDATWTRLRAGLATAAPTSILFDDVRLELEWV
jgi:hypothetical protein